MKVSCHKFKQESKRALGDSHLQKALRIVDERLRAKRDQAFRELENGEELRSKAHEIKKHTLEHLDEYLEKLESSVERIGGTVHWASDSKSACNIIENIALENRVHTIVKGKSMVTEEIELNDRLISRGFDVFETDLGEFIIQLADEPPSHIVGPAIHKTKEQISRLLSEKFNIERMDDPEDMTLFARKTLREKFLNADMGITGVNFAVSETGTIVLFENEGNIRLSTTLPRIHVAIMGIEKVIPTLNDLGVLIKLLARSATGQKMPVYMSMISGSRRKGERDGSDVFHLVILDNGRSAILNDEPLKETLFCIRCGACLNSCPVYLKAGGHAYGWVYSGPIGSILTPQMVDREKAGQLPYASTLCGACAEICPVKINIPGILLELRRRYTEESDWKAPTSLLEKALVSLYSSSMEKRFLYEKGAFAARLIQRPFIVESSLSRRLSCIKKHRGTYNIQPFSKQSFRQQFKARKGYGK